MHLLRPDAADNPPFEVPITELKNIAMLWSDSDNATQTTKASRTAELIVIRQDERIERVFLIFPTQVGGTREGRMANIGLLEVNVTCSTAAGLCV